MSPEKKRIYLPLAVIAAVLLVASVTIVPALDAFAVPPDAQPPKPPKPPGFIEHNCPNENSEKYHKDC